MYPPAQDEDEIIQESLRRMDELESGIVKDMGLEELVAGLSYLPQSMKVPKIRARKTENSEPRTSNT